ncbi:MAG: hypothetical protein K8F34_05000 [Candidatus Kuenenia stuttgartiensis]|nr:MULTISPECIES: hypothetical protein [Kuenenia]MBE7546623.1 hypothetical protein [Planctomycetia bacterium]MBZ0191029.1 hypothetical protein [Candidatus Kuenenia stuttgartiensis]MCL4726026.1 hypothetical protein [Candidatus Kuenenia stuttgartiensis]MCZ7621736.1 hypothetical protein [Candidatus Kuenenia sp.]
MSPDDAESCECGYRFPPSENRKYFLNPENKGKKSTQTIWIVVLLAIISILVIGWVIFSYVSIEKKYGSIFNQGDKRNKKLEGIIKLSANQKEQYVTLDGYDAGTNPPITIHNINLWNDYKNRSKGISVTAKHGDRVKLIRREGNGVLVETLNGKRGWVTYYLIKELK